MKNTLRRTAVLYAFLVVFLAGVGFMLFSLWQNGATWSANKANQHLYQNGATVTAGAIYDRNGVVLAQTVEGERVYHDSAAVRKATLHVVGDDAGRISTGTQYLFRDKLSGYSLVDGVYGILNDEDNQAHITLNIDCEACRTAYNAFGEDNGTVVVYNYRTGELLCSVSKPTFDVTDIPDNLTADPAYEGVFLDKAISGLYTPGSLMKIVTAVCALQNIPDVESQTFDCDKEYECSDGTVICNGTHGEVDFERAFNKSCNFAFADITLQLGADKLLATANELGFNKSLRCGDVPLKKSIFTPSAESQSELGWAGIGQSTTLLNPTHMLAIVGAIANGGTGYAPNRISEYSTFLGSYTPAPQTLVTVDPAIAQKMQQLMRSNVVNQYSESDFPNLQFCAKTGTAQLDNADSHSWMAGFSTREDLPLAVVCIVENGGWGSGRATEVGNEVMQYFLDCYT